MRRLLTMAAPLAVFAAACGSDDAGSGGAPEEQLRVVASFYPVAEAAERVGGDIVEVVNLTPAGTEPHDLELNPRQVDELQDADVVLYLGQGFQPAVEEVAERREGASVDVLEAVELEAGAIEFDDHGEEEPGEEDEHAGDEEDEHADEGALDPHFWLDPTLMADAVDRIEQALTAAGPEHAEAFAANAARYKETLAELDQDFDSALAECDRRTMVTSHAAFHYLAERYDLEQLPISGLSPESEPDPNRLAELADLINEEGVTTVFYETLVAPDVAETLAREAGVETAVLNPLEGLTQDDIDEGKDYAAVMRDNLAALTVALGCG